MEIILSFVIFIMGGLTYHLILEIKKQNHTSKPTPIIKINNNTNRYGVVESYIFRYVHALKTDKIISKIELLNRYDNDNVEVRHLEVLDTCFKDFTNPLANLNKNVKIVKGNTIRWEKPSTSKHVIDSQLLNKLLDGELLVFGNFSIKLSSELNRVNILKTILEYES